MQPDIATPSDSAPVASEKPSSSSPSSSSSSSSSFAKAIVTTTLLSAQLQAVASSEALASHHREMHVEWREANELDRCHDIWNSFKPIAESLNDREDGLLKMLEERMKRIVEENEQLEKEVQQQRQLQLQQQLQQQRRDKSPGRRPHRRRLIKPPTVTIHDYQARYALSIATVLQTALQSINGVLWGCVVRERPISRTLSAASGAASWSGLKMSLSVRFSITFWSLAVRYSTRY